MTTWPSYYALCSMAFVSISFGSRICFLLIYHWFISTLSELNLSSRFIRHPPFRHSPFDVGGVPPEPSSLIPSPDSAFSACQAAAALAFLTSFLERPFHSFIQRTVRHAVHARPRETQQPWPRRASVALLWLASVPSSFFGLSLFMEKTHLPVASLYKVPKRQISFSL